MEIIKTFFDIVQKILASAAIIGAGLWFLYRFEYMPKANISQDVTTSCFSKDIRWVRTNITIENQGNARLVLGRQRHQIAGILPIGEPDTTSQLGKISWPALAELDVESVQIFLESNERQKLYYDFFIPSQVSLIESTIWFENLSASKNTNKYGWSDTSVFTVPGDVCE